MKHNGLANLFLGIIYGAIFSYIHAFVKPPGNIGLMFVILLFAFLFTLFLYDMNED